MPRALGPARRVDAPLRCAGLQGHTTWLGLGGRVRRGFVVQSRRAHTPSRRRRAAIRRLDGRRPLVRRRGLRLWHHARIRLRDGQGAGGASAHSQRAQSLNRARLWAGRGAGSRLGGSVLSSCSGYRGVLAFGQGQKQRAEYAAGDPGVDWGVLCACRGVAGDVPGRWRGRRHARITQRRHVGELEPE